MDYVTQQARKYTKKTFQNIKISINQLHHDGLGKTKELGRINRVDPLEITYLRIRGMWGIDSPQKVFKTILPSIQPSDNFLCAIILSAKYDQYPEIHRKAVEKLQPESFTIKDVEIPFPDNPAKLLPAKVLFYRYL